MHPAGWYYAPGDPPDTLRYWNGTQWLGPAMPPDQRQTSGGFDLIPPVEPIHPTAHLGDVPGRPPIEPHQHAATQTAVHELRSERLLVGVPFLLILGLILGIAGHNIVTVFSTATEVPGTVTKVREQNRLRGAITRVEVSTDVGQFYWSTRSRNLTGPGPQSGMSVTVLYSERTGGQIAIDEFTGDRRVVGRYLWPALAAMTAIVASAKIRSEFSRFRDRVSIVFLGCYLVIGPIIGLLIFDALDAMLTTVYAAP